MANRVLDQYRIETPSALQEGYRPNFRANIPVSQSRQIMPLGNRQQQVPPVIDQNAVNARRAAAAEKANAATNAKYAAQEAEFANAARANQPVNMTGGYTPNAAATPLKALGGLATLSSGLEAANQLNNAQLGLSARGGDVLGTGIGLAKKLALNPTFLAGATIGTKPQAAGYSAYQDPTITSPSGITDNSFSQAKSALTQTMPVTQNGLPQTSPKILPLASSTPVTDEPTPSPNGLDNQTGTATVRQVQSPYTYPAGSGKVGGNVNTLLVDNGIGGTGSIQFKDGRKLSQDQMNSLQNTIQYNALPSTKEMYARQAAEVQARHDKNVAYDMANTPRGLSNKQLAIYNTDRTAFANQQNAQAEALGKKYLADAKRYDTDERQKTQREGNLLNFKANKAVNRQELAAEQNKPGFTNEELDSLPKGTPDDVVYHLKTMVKKPYVDDLKDTLSAHPVSEHDAIYSEFAKKIGIDNPIYLKSIIGGGFGTK